MAAVHTAIPSPRQYAPEHPVQHYSRVRSTTLSFCAPLATEDYVVQSMPDASPAKWHLAHTTWFFEEFVLKSFTPGYQAFHPQYEFLFNSYYQSVGRMHERPRRGLLTRPSVDEIWRYREHVDEHMTRLLEERDDERLMSTHRARTQSRAAASGTAADRPQASVLVQSAAARVSGARSCRSRSVRRRCSSLRSMAASAKSAQAASISASTTRRRDIARSSIRTRSAIG